MLEQSQALQLSGSSDSWTVRLVPAPATFHLASLMKMGSLLDSFKPPLGCIAKTAFNRLLGFFSGD